MESRPAAVKRTWPLAAAALACFAAGGAVFAAVERLPVTTGWYWAVETATTVGYGDITPKTSTGRLVAVVVMLLAIPLLASVFAKMSALHARALLREDLNLIRETADKAHRIAADTYRHATGDHHPDAPHRED
jgi:voltage-gated potassium channel Kch